MNREREDTKICDLFGNGGEGECGGPLFTDPQPEGVNLRVCAFHTLLNRNGWVKESARLQDRVERLEKAAQSFVGEEWAWWMEDSSMGCRFCGALFGSSSHFDDCRVARLRAALSPSTEEAREEGR